MTKSIQFLAAFLRNPRAVGAIAPSSRWLAKMIVSDMGIEEAEMVAELGPGTGAFTGTILETLGPDTRYVALELCEKLASSLSEKHPTANIINDSAERLPEHLERLGARHAQSIVCGLPWAAFPPELSERVMKSVLESLPEGGRFATFAYIHALWLPAARKFRRFLESNFSDVTTTRIVWRNLPPAYVYRCTK